MTRYQKMLNGSAKWVGYYRYNVDKFAKDYLHLQLRPFQKILLVMMFWSSKFLFISSRGLGKSFLSAIYCVTRCILYPHTRICIASSVRGQSILVLEKIIQELKPLSPELCAEIDDKETKMNGTEAQIVFKNHSVIKVVTASDSSRGNRCCVLLVDECRLVPKDTIDTVLGNFLTYRRMPRYEKLTPAQRKAEYDKEKNLTLFLTSAHFKDNWVYQQCQDTYDAMISGKRKQFVCGFPYQLGISEGIINPDKVIDDMLDSNYSEIKWSMEMGAMWYGSAEDAFFDFETISKNRRIAYPMLPDKLASLVGGSSLVRIPLKQNGEIRILSADIALMSSKKNKNDATAIFINQLKPTKAGRYSSNIVYAESCEGLRTDDQALIIRKLFDEFSCDYLVLDAQGLGLGCYDMLARDMSDPETGEIYPALSCCNNQEMAARCTVMGAKKVIWAIKASAQFNSDCAFILREGFSSGRIRLLLDGDMDNDALIKKLPKYKTLTEIEKEKLKMPYVNTTLLIDELTKLEHESVGGKVRIHERSGMRKDRYSSLAYNFYVATQLETKLERKYSANVKSSDMFIIRAPKYTGRVVSDSIGKETFKTSSATPSWTNY